jgi:hypothetical protein
MVLRNLCTSCGKENSFTPIKTTRGDLQMEVGDEVKVNCKSCGKIENIHLNKVYAIADNKILIVGVILGIVVSIILWNMFGAIATATMTIPILIWVYENKMANNFNRYKIRRK